jgi:hypothetical protein
MVVESAKLLRESGGRWSECRPRTRTRVLFQGQTYQPSDLERGDQIDARAYPGSNAQYVADTITVTRNVRQ